MNDPATRLYGTADPSNHQDAAQNGMRGESAGDVADPAYHRTVTPEDQPAIEVEEVSGVAFAEASRPAPPAQEPLAAAAPVPPAVAPAPAPVPAATRVRAEAAASPWPWFVASLAVGFMIGRGAARRPAAARAPGRHELDQVLI